MLNLYEFRKFGLVRKTFLLLASIFFSACGHSGSERQEKIITVSIAPFRYFIEAIGGSDFRVNVMVPAGSNPHIYEPAPGQIFNLSKSSGYVSDGFLGFEITWLDRFYDMNRTMKKLSLGNNILPLATAHHHDGAHEEGADPHYWVSPKCAMTMALSVKDFLCGLNPGGREKYEAGYASFLARIEELDKKAEVLFSSSKRKTFMIFHPNLGYLARDYGLTEISVESEGKEPTPSRMKQLIDKARAENIKTIFVQREYDTKSAREIALEIGARVRLIDPLAEDWLSSETEIIDAVHASLNENSN